MLAAKNRTLRRYISWIGVSVWAFPLVISLFFILLTSFKISGSSVGTYYPRFYGPSARDPNLLYGQPQAIRSDEWLGGTQEIINQSKLGFPKINPDLGDVSLAEIPNKDWSTVFKPQLWGFFFLPLEIAFALKWWSVMAALIISCYFFTLRILPGEKFFAILTGISFGLSPFLLWWYQSGAFMSLAYGFMMVVLIMRIFNREKVRYVNSQNWSDFIYIVGLAAILAFFGLILYPPFQISVAVVVLFFGLGFIAQKKWGKDGLPWRALFRPIAIVAAALLVAAIIGGVFIATHRHSINALNSSLYPGHRVVHGGDLPMLKIFDSFVMPVSQSGFRGGHFFTNQSEASNFILLLPFLLIPGFVLMFREWRLKKRIDWVFLALQACGLLLFVRVFVPYGNTLFKLLLLNKVPNGRLIIGFGFLGVIQLIYLIKKIYEVRTTQRNLNILAALYGLSVFIVLLWTGSYIYARYPLYLHNWWLIIAFAASFTAIVIAFLSGRRTLASILLLGFTLLSSFRIMPLYHGLSILTHTRVVEKMELISSFSDKWVTVGDDAGLYENFGWLAGRSSLSGVHGAPDLKLWKQVAGPSYENVYNREGHVFFTDNPGMKTPLELIQSDAYRVKFQCSDFIRNNADFALSVHPLSFPCLQLKSTVGYPNITFYLYEVN